MSIHSLRPKGGTGKQRGRLTRCSGLLVASRFLLGITLLSIVLPSSGAQAAIHDQEVSHFLPLRSVLGGLWGGGEGSVFEQRAIQDKKEPVEEPEKVEGGVTGETPPGGSPAQDGGEGATSPAASSPPAASPSPAAKEAILPKLEETAPIEPKSPARAFLLSAAIPGLGELYSGSNRGYLFLGVEAVSWITYASFRASSNDKEGEMFAYADDHFSINAFEQDCVGQPNLPCSRAVDDLQGFYRDDRDEYYEIISKNPIYRTGWGVQIRDGGFIYENCDANAPPGTCPPAEGSDAYREWVADQAASQDSQYAAYNSIRDDRNSLSRTARGMTMVALVNHVVSAWDAFMAARGVNAVAHGLKRDMGGQVKMDLKFKGSFGNPGARFVLRRAF